MRNSSYLSPITLLDPICLQIFLTDLLPKTATGKLQRRMIADAMLKHQEPKAKP